MLNIFKKTPKEIDTAVIFTLCPRCKNLAITRSAIYPTDGIFHRQFYDCYRCESCGFRTWKMTRKASIRFLILFFVIVATSGTIGFLARESKPSAETIARLNFNTIKERASTGDGYAELQMGLYYSNGIVVSNDDQTAVRWFEKAANHNQVEAQYRLGQALLDGRGIAKNVNTAFYWIEQSALHGNAKAQLSLGDLYGSGIGVALSKDRAYLWFSLAAAQGIEKAIYARDLLAPQLDINQLSVIDDEAQRMMKNKTPNFITP
jgi:predicted RNA-binding Zn-ribbon protein involved in translation (DUF1610 family)